VNAIPTFDKPTPKLTKREWDLLAKAAWEVRRNAHLYGPTAVGAAALTANNRVFVGCNVEHRFRSHDVHAEVNAVTTMVAQGEKELRALMIAAERDRFTPCGACMDWIFQFGGESCEIGSQRKESGEIEILTAGELMPHYPS
jgi:cytidine deaminase